VLVDEESMNGTFLGTSRLHAHTPVVLKHGSMVRLGRVWLEVRLEAALPTAQPTQATKDLALALVARALGNGDGGPRLRVVEGPDEGKEVSLSQTESPVVIGRGAEADFPVDVSDASRRHARVIRRGEAVLLRDLGSRNGTRVGEDFATVDRDTVLRPGASFEIGEDVFVYEHPAVEALREIEGAEDEAIEPEAAMGEPPKSSVESTPPPPEPAPTPGPAAAPTPALRPAYPRNVRRRAASKGPEWGKTDVLIVLLALAVLSLSAVGLFWLFRA